MNAPTIEFDGQRLINFSSNDYLALSCHPKMVEASIVATKEFGTSSSSSRVLTGTLPLHYQIENRLKTHLGKESTLLFNSGYQLNFSLLSLLPDNETLLFLDHNCHRSLIEGALHSKAKFKRFAHNDLFHLKRLLEKYPAKKRWIVTESLFSMDGDFSPLDELIEIKKEFNCTLLVDDAHALGVYGPLGMGLAAKKDVDIIVGTFGKAFGSFGAFVACSQEIQKQLINSCPAFIYTTALPPSVLGAIDCALTLIPQMDQERAKLRTLSAILKGQSQIVPYLLGTAEKALEKAEELKKAGLLALAIRPPTVVTSMLRFSLTAAHSLDDVKLLAKHLI